MRIGILGAGQLAQLLAHAAYQLGLEVICYAESTDYPAARNSKIFQGKLSDTKRLQEFLRQVDLITVENENIEIEILNFIANICPLFPNSKAVGIAQDRLLEKSFFKNLGIPAPDFINIDSLATLKAAQTKLSPPALLKTRRFGYDGKGQIKIKTSSDCESAWLAINEASAILEAFLPFDYEVSIIGAKNQTGQICCFPLIYNQHAEGILRVSTVDITSHPLQNQAENYLRKVMEELDYIGVLAIEFFVKDNQLYANEMAPRVHNSGHLTIEAANCSQFELHLRAITNLSLPKLEIKQPTAMINLIGNMPEQTTLLKDPNLHFYDYGKAAKPNRKLGHITIVANNLQTLHEKVARVSLANPGL